MPPRLSLLLTLLALAVFPAAAQAVPAGRTLIASGDATLTAALPAPVGMLSATDYRGALSDDGRYVAFASTSDGLSTEDDNRYRNVFVKDRVTGTVTLASRRTGAAGEPSHGECYSATISDDGTRVAFACARALAPSDANQHLDVYVRDLQTQTTTLASVATGGAVANADAQEPMISGNGQVVVFSSGATNLDPDDGDAGPDIYWRRLGASPETALVSRATGLHGARGDLASNAPSVTDDGSFVSFTTRATNLGAFPDGNGLADIYVRGVVDKTTELASAPEFSGAATGNADAEYSVISGQPNTGQYYVAFSTTASNLGPMDTNARTDVYRRALLNGTTVLISRTSGPTPDAIGEGAQLGGISDSGTDVAFTTTSGLDPADTTYRAAAYVRHGAGAPELLSRRDDAGPEMDVSAFFVSASGDGKAYAFGAAHGGGTSDADPEQGTAFVRDLHASPRRTEQVARPAGNAPFVNQGADAWLKRGVRTISADGSRVAFVASRNDVHRPEAWVRDMRTGALVLVSRADGPGGAPADGSVQDVTISADGNRVAFSTYARLDPADTDDQMSVYVRDLATSRTFLVSRADGAAGASATEWAAEPALDAHGDRVAFTTNAPKLAAADTDSQYDVYVRDLGAGRTLLASGGTDGGAGAPQLDASGNRVVYWSSATDIGDGDKDSTTDVHLRDLTTGAQRLVSATPQGVKGNAGSFNPAISDDGTVVAFITASSTLLPAGATKSHLVVRDLAHATLVVADRQSGANGALSADSVNALALSGDGTTVAWAAIDVGPLPPDPFAVPAHQVYVRDLRTNTTVIGSRADGPDGAMATRTAGYPSLTRDGGCLAFGAKAPLVAGAGTDYQQVFVRALSDTCLPSPAPAPGPGPGGGGGGSGADTTAPVLSGVRLTRKRFAIAARATALVASRRRGTVLRFTTSEAGTLRVKVQRRRKGAFRPTAKLVRTVAAGEGRLRFSGRIGRHALRRGRYRLAITLTDAAGNRSPVVKVRFRIVR